MLKDTKGRSTYSGMASEVMVDAALEILTSKSGKGIVVPHVLDLRVEENSRNIEAVKSKVEIYLC